MMRLLIVSLIFWTSFLADQLAAQDWAEKMFSKREHNFGTVARAGTEELTVEIADGVRIKVLRSTVSSVLAKTEPARGDRDDDYDDDEDEDLDEDEAPPPPRNEGRRRSGSNMLTKKR